MARATGDSVVGARSKWWWLERHNGEGTVLMVIIVVTMCQYL